jgi:hypothetical protein
MLELILLVLIAVLLAGILAATKAGFNEVIKGLEALNQSTARGAGDPSTG